MGQSNSSLDAGGAAVDGSRHGESSGLGPLQYVPVGGPIPADNGIRVVCPRCRSVLMPPATIFRCPCGQLMTFQAPPSSQPGGQASASSQPSALGRMRTALANDINNTTIGLAPQPYAQPDSRVILEGPGGVVIRRAGARNRPLGLEDRIRLLLERLPPQDPHACFLRALLDRLPRRPDGSIDHTALEEIARQVDAAMRGAPEALINLLPTRRFARSSLPGERDRREEHTSCMVCLSEYDEGDLLRTLPCLHAFHKDCIDPWLKGNKTCPICKTAIDVDSSEAIEKQEAEEAAMAEKRGRSSTAPASALGAGSAAGADGGGPIMGQGIYAGGVGDMPSRHLRDRSSTMPAAAAAAGAATYAASSSSSAAAYAGLGNSPYGYLGAASAQPAASSSSSYQPAYSGTTISSSQTPPGGSTGSSNGYSRAYSGGGGVGPAAARAGVDSGSVNGGGGMPVEQPTSEGGLGGQRTRSFLGLRFGKKAR